MEKPAARAQQLENQLQQLKASYEQSQLQCKGADQRLQDALREARLTLAQEFGAQAREIRKKRPETSLLLAAKSLSITQREGAPPVPAAFQQVRDLLDSSDGRELRGHEGPVAVLAESHDGKWLASGDHGGKVRLWPTASAAPEAPKVFDGHWDRITQLMFTADDRWLISGSADSAVALWNLSTNDSKTPPLAFRGKQQRLVALAVSDDGRWLAAASTGMITSDNSVRIWDLHANDINASAVDLPTYMGRVHALAISHDGQWLATGDDDGSLRLWRFGSPSHSVAAMTLRVHPDPVRAVSFSPNGRWLITAASNDSGKGTIVATNLSATEVSADVVLSGDSHRIERFAITSDGRWLITASEEPSLRVWDLNAIDQRQAGTVLAGQESAVQAIVLSTNGCWMATVGSRQRRSPVEHCRERPGRPAGNHSHRSGQRHGHLLCRQRRLAGHRQRPRFHPALEPPRRRADPHGQRQILAVAVNVGDWLILRRAPSPRWSRSKMRLSSSPAPVHFLLLSARLSARRTEMNRSIGISKSWPVPSSPTRMVLSSAKQAASTSSGPTNGSHDTLPRSGWFGSSISNNQRAL